MLIIFGGLPGAGKTTIAKALAQKIKATYLRIDSIEQSLKRAGIKSEEVGASGYEVGYAVAKENLQLGLIVISDSVNPLEITRQAWKQVAADARVRFFEIEITCSDQVEHHSRVESRQADIAGHKLPSWQDVCNKEYEPWESDHFVVDTAKTSVSEAVDLIIRKLKM